MGYNTQYSTTPLDCSAVEASLKTSAPEIAPIKGLDVLHHTANAPIKSNIPTFFSLSTYLAQPAPNTLAYRA
jgi:hypothetical protein